MSKKRKRFKKLWNTIFETNNLDMIFLCFLGGVVVLFLIGVWFITTIGIRL